jgi:putative transcriptional regulator
MSSNKRNWLIKKRKKLKLKQSEVAEKSGISRSFYINIESGTRNPSLRTASKIAKVLEVDIEKFNS